MNAWQIVNSFTRGGWDTVGSAHQTIKSRSIDLKGISGIHCTAVDDGTQACVFPHKRHSLAGEGYLGVSLLESLVPSHNLLLYVMLPCYAGDIF